MEFNLDALLNGLLLASLAEQNKTHAKAVKYLCNEFNISVYKALEVISKLGLILSESEVEE